MGEQTPTGAPPHASETALRISERYGVPPEEVDAIIADRQIRRGQPHPMTMGALMNEHDTFTGAHMAQSQSRWSPADVVGIVLGILGILAIATLFIFLLSWNKQPHPTETIIRDTVRVVEAAPPVDTMASEPIVDEAPAMAPPRTVARRRTAPAPLLSTSNSLEAEERLAELKAAGNTKARITRVNRGGTTIYQVRK